MLTGLLTNLAYVLDAALARLGRISFSFCGGSIDFWVNPCAYFLKLLFDSCGHILVEISFRFYLFLVSTVLILTMAYVCYSLQTDL